MEQQHPPAAEPGSLLRPKASLLPKINTAAIQGRLLQRNISAGEHNQRIQQMHSSVLH
jgi:hypothetical protein